MNSIAIVLLFVMLLALPARRVNAQVDPIVYTSPPDVQYQPPAVFDTWCDQMKVMYGDSCQCDTKRGISHTTPTLVLDHTVVCDPLPGHNMTCIDGVTIENATVILTAISAGDAGNYTYVSTTQLQELFVDLKTSIGTTSFKYSNPNFGQRTNGCRTIWGAYNCPACGICDMPPPGVEVSPNDIFDKISGDCRFGHGLKIGKYNACKDGDNQMTRTLFSQLQIRNETQRGACPGYSPITLPPKKQAFSGSVNHANALLPATVVAGLAAYLSS